jgi:1-acyl-sn-glycerol-3-phosphate acyltransferase
VLYQLIKIPARIALPFYCKKVKLNMPDVLHWEGPLLLACNHPNAFLDAIILSTLFKKPIYSLARGDAFKNKRSNALLRKLNMLPIHRLSEGSDYIQDNYKTFEDCIHIFREGGIVLIFAEGTCVNEWKLRSLKKGTARLAFTAWESGIDLTVLPVGINYNAFKSLGKTVQINFGKKISKPMFTENALDGLGIKAFNEHLYLELQKLVFESDNEQSVKQHFGIKDDERLKWKKLFLLGKWLHLPIVIPIRNLSVKLLPDTDFYDSFVIGLLIFLYPLYLSLIAGILFLFLGGWYWALVFLLLPLLAWLYVKVKK